jgi:hypothetical protein
MSVQILDGDGVVQIVIDGVTSFIEKSLFFIDDDGTDIVIYNTGSATGNPFYRRTFTDFTQPSGAASASAYVALVQDAISNTTDDIRRINISAGGNSNYLSNIVFSNSNGVTFGLNGSTVTASVAGGGGLTNINVSAGTTSNNLSNIVFSNSNGISFGLNGSTITGSYTVPTVTNSSFSVEDSATTINPVARIAFSTGNNITLTLSTNISSVTVGVSHNLAGTNTALNLTNLTGTLSVNSNGVSLSMSADAGGGGGGGMTVSQFPQSAPPMATSSNYSGATTTTAGGSRTTVSLYVSPLVVQNVVSFNRVFQLLSHATVAGTGSITYGNAYGLYTLNGGTALSLVSSFGFGFRLSQNSVTARSHYWYWGTNSTSNSSSVGGNISASVARLNMVLYSTGANSLQTGNYWIVYGQTQSSAGAAVGSFSNMNVSFSQSTMGSMFGTNVSSRPLLMGIVSTTTTNTVANNVSHILPSSIATTAITGTGGSSQNRSQIIFMVSQI